MNTISKLILVILTIENFPTAVFDKLGLLHGNVVYKIRNKNLKFIARAGTEDLAEIVVVGSGSEYDMKLINLPTQPVIVDLGAYIGDFCIPTARKFKDKCKIYALEPDKENYEILIKNIGLNKIHSIYPQNIAISDYTGKGYLKKDKLTTDGYYLDRLIDKITNCKISTLSGALNKYKLNKIDLLKMDIEGGEYKIFLHKDSLNYIQKNVHYIFMEYHNIDKKNNSSLIKKIIKQKFSIIRETKNTFTLENLNWKND